jgi:hypothetical protein
MFRFVPRSVGGLVVVMTVIVAASACGADDTPASAPAPDAATTTTVTTTVPVSSVPPNTEATPPTAATSTSAPVTTAPVEPTALDDVLSNGYGTAEDWRVETVVTDLPIATGGIAIADDGTIYQADFGDGSSAGDTVYRVGSDGTLEPFSRSDDFELLTMTTFGPDGTLYQSSYGSGKVFRLADDGTPTVIADGLRGPTGLVIIEDGTVFAQAYDTGVIHRIGPDGTVTEFARGGGMSGPNGLVLGPDDTLYSVNHRNGGLHSIAADGNVTELHRFPAPTAHVALLDDALFITSRGSFVIYRYDLSTGDIDVVAGNGEPGDQDGVGTEASFGRPNAIAVGPDGALYFNHGDGSTNSPVTIRRLVPAS